MKFCLAFFVFTATLVNLLNLKVVAGGSLSHFIVGGIPAVSKQFPWQLSLRYFGYNRCGASLITENRALTSVQCKANYEKVENFTILAGSLSRYGDLGSYIIGIDKFIEHPDYDETTLQNDIAVVWLQRKLEFSAYLRAVALPRQNEPLIYGTTVLISGWGFRSEKYPSSVPEILHYTTLIAIQREKCSEIYGDNLKDGMFCCGVARGTKGTCKLDTGGPVTAHGKQIGIISWDVGCGDRLFPGIYTDVAMYRTWIDSAL